MARVEKCEVTEVEKTRKVKLQEDKRLANEQKKLNAAQTKAARPKKRKQVQEDELTDEENAPTPGPYTASTPPALERHRPQLVPAYCGTLVLEGADQDLTAASWRFGGDVTNYTPEIDPALL
ncbi:hypothetical protein B0H10DRAFT_1943203 [Mycena sp. CBHHK59/15]|nr:hypothetical protein B0H10DRAFT_1943203 [Mycena sp. CBHHK59/15]